MITDDEDDTHYCLKCHSTVIGLNNYVEHRKSRCGKQLTNNEDVSKSYQPPDLLQTETDEPFSLKADDFFSSLELQSSNKKQSNTSGSGKSSNGVLTRSKASAVIQANRFGKDSYSYLDNSRSETSEWIPDTSDKLKKGENDSFRTFDDSDEYSDESESEEEYEESSDDDYEDDNDHPSTGGKWKPTFSPIQWSRSVSSNDWTTPPPHHTGAKWKPSWKAQTSTPEQSADKWKPSFSDTPPPSFTGSKWTTSKSPSEMKTKTKSKHDNKWQCQNEPPPEHTKGKWKPFLLSDKNNEVNRQASTSSNKSEVYSNTLSPSYTKGKWKPTTQADHTERKWQPFSTKKETEISPFRKSSGTIQYWCGPCNRSLASKVVYERHLKSDLHFKRTVHEHELDDTSYLNTNIKRILDATISSGDYSSENNSPTTGKVRRKTFITCNVCHSRVNFQLMGKHLISHYHCRKADMNLAESRKMVLENIHSILLQSPYQCNACKFYCNTQESFLQHWLSSDHKKITLSQYGFFWCSVCKLKAKSTDLMYDHLLSKEHGEMISVINRSVPVIIKRITPIRCFTCDKRFLFNIQLRIHCKKENHFYQNDFICNQCKAVFKSAIALQRHQMVKHNIKFYVCSVCSLRFQNIGEVKRHRSTPEHRYALSELRQKQGLHEHVFKSCQYCSKCFVNILKLKEHLKVVHPEQNHSCPYCGKVFAISQDLSVHIRKKTCKFEENGSKINSCDQCEFKCDSTAEILFHKVLHCKPYCVPPEVQKNNAKRKTNKRPVELYKCPICDKMFVKGSLRCHLRVHTKERPYICTLCNAGFVRRNNWMLHMRNHDRASIRLLKNVPQSPEIGDRPHLCSTCGASFKKRSVLQQHMTTHTGKSIKCPHPGCVFSARFPMELKPHLLTHSDDKPFSCEQCSYRGKTKQQLNRHTTVHRQVKKFACPQCPFTSRLAAHLKRHLRLHTGAKPFVCPHCDYCCNNLENLRKHILSTNKHPGKSIYKCKFCQEDNFETNFAKDFKVHLVTKHPETFASGKEAATYVTGIYEAINDSTSVQGLLDNNYTKQNYVKVALQGEETLSQFQYSTLSDTNNLGSAVLLTSITTQDSSDHKIQEELFPMLIVSKDNPSDYWRAIGGSYDVDESGSLVPFAAEGETLFNEHFQ